MSQQCNHAHAKSNGHSSTNGIDNHVMNNHATNHNGVCSNDLGGVEQIASPEMCFFCFEVLHRELYRIDDPPLANFTNDA